MKPPLIIDNFAGGGGASTGIERALGRPVDVAINHDAEAVAMHLANHPTTKHYCQSIMAVDPLEATGGAPVALAWFSPDCKHHSKAKGGKPREKNIRDLAWVVVHWAERLLKAKRDGSAAIQVLMLENVEEFRQWGPLDEHGQPIKERKGEEFDLWVRRLKRLGYKVEFRELRACDYGAPTSRKRLYLIARRDGLPIVWPKPSHGKPGSPEVVSGERLPWRTAAECIDWSIPCPSIFERARELKPATMRRIAHGVMRYVVKSASPFVIPVTHHGSADRSYNPAAPLPTVTAAHRGEMATIDAAVIPITHTNNGATAHSTRQPLRTITTAKGGELAAVTATLAPHITKFRTGSVGSEGGDPMPTVTANGDSARPAGATPLGLAAATMVQMGYGEREGQTPRALDVEAPLGTIVAGGNKHALVLGHLEKFSENSRGKSATEPLDTVMAGAPRHAAVTAFLSHFYTSNTNGGQGDPEQPAKTITSEGQHHAVVCAHMEQANTGRVGHAASDPVSTITAAGSHQRLVETTMVDASALPPEQLDRAVRVAAFLIKYYGNEVDGHGLDAPIGTVTTKDRFAVVTVTIDAITYVIVDIGMRMLSRRELANAQGFPSDYVLDPIGPKGKPLSISSSIRMIGNSVCPDVAEALASANVPLEWFMQEAA
ncbi:DNA (Cytosine-5)-methyltransferase 1 [Sphingomonas aurantiaca]|uniref:DNA (cytosine-5-)-methyltransferase n=1 Tax=Sphingomonas aurantiaca TaxID=185949 RepID=A0A5E7ZN38_9SPHN|nr:DNA cytosine methyltransferase [Sphingomonas aurantiaca]VVT20549.1 DNA (Cytosine-5)-methyltransferase 1 [Sphingomonas aurantiaca]